MKKRVKSYKNLLTAGIYLVLISMTTSGCDRNSAADSSETGESGTVSQISCRNRNSAEDLAMAADFKKNHRKAIDESERLCQANYALACYNLGTFYEAGKGDYQKASESYEKGCSLNFGPPCYKLGELLERGHCVSHDGKTAESYYSRSCELGYQKGCR
ncbi:MAG: sel1 repeat family protein [Ruminobacter sp.]|nr:sel1 repeat family protein [Ruminobacter sp.]